MVTLKRLRNFDLQIIPRSEIQRSLDNLKLTQEIAVKNSGALKDCVILHINHSLADVYAFNKILQHRMGSEVFFIGIPYNNKIALLNNGHQWFSLRKKLLFHPFGHKKSISLLPEIDYITLIKKQIFSIITHTIVPTLRNRKLIIIQDGGYSVFLESDKKMDFLFHRIPGFLGMIEQTSSGTKLLESRDKKNSTGYPIITVAKSELKTNFESQFIAEAIFEALQHAFKKNGDFFKYRIIYIAGYGVVGRQLAHHMRSVGVRVRIKETDEKIKRLAEEEGFISSISLTKQDFESSYCYIGCTGIESFGFAELKNFLDSSSDKYHLVSGSSKRVEFWSIISLFEKRWPKQKRIYIKKFPFLKRISSFDIKYSDIGLEYIFRYKNKEKRLILIAEGFPINFFDPNFKSVPEKVIDITQSLLLSSALLLKLSSQSLTSKVHYYKTGNQIGDTIINENDLLTRWFAINGIHNFYSFPIENFNRHPLREYLYQKK